MITAKEAIALYDASGAEADAMLKNIEPKIVDAAKAGKRNVFFLIDASEVWKNIAPTPLQNQVMDKLYALGYRVQFTRYGGSYVPAALADDDGKGPKYENFGFAIHW